MAQLYRLSAAPALDISPATALECYAALTRQAQILEQRHGDRVREAAALQLRILAILWARLNSRTASARFENNPPWEALREDFFAIVGGSKPHREPHDREIHAQVKALTLGNLPEMALAA